MTDDFEVHPKGTAAKLAAAEAAIAQIRQLLDAYRQGAPFPTYKDLRSAIARTGEGGDG